MKKFLKKLKNKINNKVLYFSVLATSPLFAGTTGTSDLMTAVGGTDNTTGSSFIKSLLVDNQFVAMIIQTVIILGVIYAVVNIAKELLGGGGQGGGVWKNAGAILFLGIVYYILFIKIGGS